MNHLERCPDISGDDIDGRYQDVAVCGSPTSDTCRHVALAIGQRHAPFFSFFHEQRIEQGQM